MAVGWSVLLRDMVEPLTDLIPRQYVSSEWLHRNLALFTVMLLVTPLCTLRSVTALKGYSGAASMVSILILGSCIVFRSIQCNIDAPEPFHKHLTLFPEDPRELLDSIPIYVFSFVCNFNILPVHNELQEPTPKRVSWWLRLTAWCSFLFYLLIAFIGSSYGHCTASGRVQGNILLDFDKGDPLLLVGRMCMAFTITFAFPMVVIPARDIILRSVLLPCLELAASPVKKEVTMVETDDEPLAEEEGGSETTQPLEVTMLEAIDEALEEGDYERRKPSEESSPPPTEQSSTTATPQNASFLLRLLTAIGIFWTAVGVASGVDSIYIVWELLGSSLSILLSQLIPCGCYLVITKDREGDVASKWLAWLLILVFTPLMFLLTANAVSNAFFD
jgi:amino acid permease